MPKAFVKELEKLFKRLLKGALCWLLPELGREIPSLEAVRKVLVFRLDQRVGNGLLLLPLLRAIRRSKPDVELHLLIHYPIADLFQHTTGRLLDTIWPYNQALLMRRPWKYLQLFYRLRKESFEVVFSSNNPDNFSLSQALLGRVIKPRRLIGFNARESRRFFDIAVTSTTEKHYADAMVDLWRLIDPQAVFLPGGLQVDEDRKSSIGNDFPEYRDGGILIWLGATKDKFLPAELFTYLFEKLSKYGNLPIHFAAGPADEALLQQYPPWIRKKTRIWNRQLPETAAFFSLFPIFISGDTGPLHLATALDRLTLGIFRVPNIQQYGYHDGRRHFTLLWEGTVENRLQLNGYLKELLPVAAKESTAPLTDVRPGR